MNRDLSSYKGYEIRGSLPLDAYQCRKKKLKYNLLGRAFGRLVVLECLGFTKTGRRVWGCVCSCGKKKGIKQDTLLAGLVNSCGCILVEHCKSIKIKKLPYGEAAFNHLFSSYKAQAIKRGYEFRLEKKYFRSLVESSCFYCGADREGIIKAENNQINGSFQYTGIDRINSSKGYIEGNVRSCCKWCNYSKNCRDEKDFLEWIERVYKRTAGHYLYGRHLKK